MPAPKVTKDQEVLLVTAWKDHLPARVVSQARDGTVTLTAEYAGKPITISSSPYDPAGAAPDSWHIESVEGDAATDGGKADEKPPVK